MPLEMEVKSKFFNSLLDLNVANNGSLNHALGCTSQIQKGERAKIYSCTTKDIVFDYGADTNLVFGCFLMREKDLCYLLISSCGRMLLAKRQQNSEFVIENELFLPLPTNSRVTQAWYASGGKRLLYEVQADDTKYTLYATTLPPDSETLEASSMGESVALCSSRLISTVYILQSEVLVLTNSPAGLYYLFTVDEATYTINTCYVLVFGATDFKLRHELGSSLAIAASRCTKTWRNVPEYRRKPKRILKSTSKKCVAAVFEDSSLSLINGRGEYRLLKLTATRSLDDMIDGFICDEYLSIVHADEVVLYDASSGKSIQHVNYDEPIRGVWFSDVSTSHFGIWTSTALHKLTVRSSDYGSKDVLAKAIEHSAAQTAIPRDLLEKCVSADVHHPAIIAALFSQDKSMTGPCSKQKALLRERCENSFLPPSALSDQLDPLVKELWQLDSDTSNSWNPKQSISTDDRISSVVEALFIEKANTSLIAFREAAECHADKLVNVLLKSLGLVDQVHLNSSERDACEIELDSVCLQRWAQLVTCSPSDCSLIYRAVLTLVARTKPDILISFVRVAQAVGDRQADAAFRSPGQMYDMSARVLQSILTTDNLNARGLEASAEIFLKSSLDSRELIAFELFRRAKCWLRLKDLSLACSALQSAALRRLCEADQMMFVLEVVRSQAQRLPLHKLLLELEGAIGSTEVTEIFNEELCFGDMRDMLLTSLENEMRDSLSII